MIYQLVNLKTEVLPLATSHIIPHLCNQFYHVLALLIYMLRFKIRNFYQNIGLEYYCLLQKIQNFRALCAPPPDPLPHCKFRVTRLDLSKDAPVCGRIK